LLIRGRRGSFNNGAKSRNYRTLDTAVTYLCLKHKNMREAGKKGFELGVWKPVASVTYWESGHIGYVTVVSFARVTRAGQASFTQCWHTDTCRIPRPTLFTYRNRNGYHPQTTICHPCRSAPVCIPDKMKTPSKRIRAPSASERLPLFAFRAT